MNARDSIFQSIEAAIGRPGEADAIRRAADALLTDPDVVRPKLPEGSTIELFEAAVAKLPPGASVERIASMEDLPAAVAGRLGQKGLAPSLKLQPHPGLTALDWSRAGLSLAEEVDDRVSLSIAETGIAETATLVLRSGSDMAILDAFLPLHHIVAVRSEDLVRHLDDAFGRADLKRSRNLVLVTGPSGTTDIEGSLVIGVHGPATLHIIVVGDGGQAATSTISGSQPPSNP